MKKIKIYLIIAIFAVLQSCSNDDNSNNNSNNVIVSNNVGDQSNAYLSANTFTSLEVELAYEPGVRPTDAAIDSLRSFLEKRLNKTAIQFKYTELPNLNIDEFSIAEIRGIENTFRTSYNTGTTVTAFFLFADGSYDQDSGNSVTLGVAFNASAMAIFQGTIQDNTGLITQPSAEDVEEGVLKHEFAHILGLVNLGSPLQSEHEDAEHPKHCDVQSCLMYYTIETGSFFNNLMNGPMPDLDAQCIADLRANGGK